MGTASGWSPWECEPKAMGNIFIQNHASYIGILWGGGQVIVCMMNVSSRVGSYLIDALPVGITPHPHPLLFVRGGTARK